MTGGTRRKPRILTDREQTEVRGSQTGGGRKRKREYELGLTCKTSDVATNVFGKKQLDTLFTQSGCPVYSDTTFGQKYVDT